MWEVRFVKIGISEFKISMDAVGHVAEEIVPHVVGARLRHRALDRQRQPSWQSVYSG